MEEEGGKGCKIELSLGLGYGYHQITSRRNERKRQLQLSLLYPSRPKTEVFDVDNNHVEDVTDRSSSENRTEEQTTKKDDISSNIDANNYGNARKKLKLTKEQSTLLEDKFKQQSTLTMAQKQELAEQLDLRPRQVEVWFQNRRARTKLKQIEVDCELLKKCYESLNEENRRLKKELQELRSSKFGTPSPFYVQLPKTAVLTMCPSCEKIAKAYDSDDVTNSNV